MLHGLSLKLASLIWCTRSSVTHFSFCPTAQPQFQILLKAFICSKQTASTCCIISSSEDAVHCHYDVFRAAGGYSAGCRTSWVCLQQHATLVTSNGVTVCGSKFPPTVSKHCKHQHCAVPKTIQAMWNTDNPKVLLPQPNIMTALVHSNSSLFSDVSSVLPT